MDRSRRHRWKPLAIRQRAGIIAMGVPDDDELIAAELVSGKETIFIGTHDGMAFVSRTKMFVRWAARPTVSSEFVSMKATMSSA